jgi:GMP synthase (glutamine-hydrolysing)
MAPRNPGQITASVKPSPAQVHDRPRTRRSTTVPLHTRLTSLRERVWTSRDEPVSRLDHRWVTVQHVPYESPGLIAAEAGRRGIELSVCHVYRGDRLPDLDELDGLIVMGGPMGVEETASHPYLTSEIELLAATATAGKPVLGVCLGAQLLAAALGGRVYRGERAEIGSGVVSLTVDGRGDPVFGATGQDELPVVHWHQDTFDLPPGAVRLAYSEIYPNQAFRAGKYVYGVQFHVEVDDALAEDWRTRLPKDVVIEESARVEVEHVGRRIISAFFDSALQTDRLEQTRAEAP